MDDDDDNGDTNNNIDNDAKTKDRPDHNSDMMESSGDESNEFHTNDNDNRNTEEQDTATLLSFCARRLTLYRACLVAVASLEERIHTSRSVPRVVQCNRHMLQLQDVCLQTESALRAVARRAGTGPVQSLLFHIMDYDRDGVLGLADLTHAFAKMDANGVGGAAYCTHVWNAQKALDQFSVYNNHTIPQHQLQHPYSSDEGQSTYDQQFGRLFGRNKQMMNTNKTLTLPEFKLFLEDLEFSMECDSTETLCEMLLLWLCFNETGHAILDEALDVVVAANEQRFALDDNTNNSSSTTNNETKQDFSDEVIEIRLAMIFQILDWDGSGLVRFADVVQLLWQIVEESEEEDNNSGQSKRSLDASKREGKRATMAGDNVSMTGSVSSSIMQEIHTEEDEEEILPVDPETGEPIKIPPTDKDKQDGDLQPEAEAIAAKKSRAMQSEAHKKAVKKALFFSTPQRTEMDYRQFTTLLLHVSTLTHQSLHCLVDRMTVESAAVFQMKDMDRKVTKQNFLRELFETAATANPNAMPPPLVPASLTTDGPDENGEESVENARLKILFSLWDQDGSGTIDVQEFVLGLRKLQSDSSSSNESMHMATEQAITTMLEFDNDQNQQLDLHEFARALGKYANAMYITLDELIDFMVVASALRDNEKADEAYMKKFKKQLMRQLPKKSKKRSRPQWLSKLIG